MTASSQMMPALPPNRRGVVGQWFALIGAAIAIAVVVALIVTWPDHGDSSTKAGAGPAAAKQSGKHPAARAAAFKP
jgi:hypothetical protein